MRNLRDSQIMVLLVRRTKVEELPHQRELTMGCEFAGQETYKREKLVHVKLFCVATHEACLIDDELGYTHCTRRLWLMTPGRICNPAQLLQEQKPKRRRTVEMVLGAQPLPLDFGAVVDPRD